MEIENNEKHGLGEFYINKEDFTNSDDLFITLNFDKTQIANITCKDTAQNAKVYVEILESK